MSISPFSARPAPSGGDRSEIGQRRARLAIAIATVGIAATLLAYAISPGVRHAVSHATHSVKHAVGNVLDHDAAKKAHRTAPVAPARTKRSAYPAPSAKQAIEKVNRLAGKGTVVVTVP
jgi:hypothetical protein